MRSISTSAAVALAVSGSALGASTSFPKRQNSKTVTLPLFQGNGIAYLANITVGTPPQTVTVQVDTGSSDLWVYAKTNQCNDRQGCLGGSYDPSASSSFKDIAKGGFSSKYGDGSTAVGDYMTETIGFGGVTITNMTMGISYEADSALPFWGIMGIDFPVGEFSDKLGELYYNLPYWMTEQGLINEPVYSLYLDDISSSTSNLLFGGIDTDKFNAPLTIFDVIPIESPRTGADVYEFYQVPLTAVGGINSKGTTSSFTFPDGGIPVVLDSGSTASTLPQDTVADIFSQLGVTNSSTYGPVVPCSFANSDITLAFQFGGNGGALIGVSMADMVFSGAVASAGGTDYCRFGISAGSPGGYILGDTFLRSAYVVFDPGNGQVGLAQAKPDVFASANSALAATATVPSLIGLQNPTSVGQGTGYGTGGIPGSTVNADAAAATTAAATTALGRAGGVTSNAGTLQPTAASTGLRGGTSIAGIASVYQTHASVNAVVAATGAASSSKAAAAGLRAPGLASLVGVVGTSLVVLVAGLGGAAVVFSGL